MSNPTFGQLTTATSIAIVAMVGACNGQRTASSQRAASAHDARLPATGCRDTVGEWSGIVDGLRGRLVTSGSRPDRSALRVTIELQNMSAQDPLEIHWDGRTLGFVTFRLDDATGVEIGPPDWSFGGNEAVGNSWVTIPAASTVHYIIEDNVFSHFQDRRVVRIGVFWAREMPVDGSSRFLHATVTGTAPTADPGVEYTGPDGRQGIPPAHASTKRFRAWIGKLDLPSVCVE